MDKKKWKGREKREVSERKMRRRSFLFGRIRVYGREVNRKESARDVSLEPLRLHHGESETEGHSAVKAFSFLLSIEEEFNDM